MTARVDLRAPSRLYLDGRLVGRVLATADDGAGAATIDVETDGADGPRVADRAAREFYGPRLVHLSIGPVAGTWISGRVRVSRLRMTFGPEFDPVGIVLGVRLGYRCRWTTTRRRPPARKAPR